MRHLAALTLLASFAAAQQPYFQPFGTGCAFNGQTLAIGNQGLPQLGQTFQVLYSGPNFTFSPGQQIAWPNLVLGFGTQLTPLPPGLLPQQPAGCLGYITPDAVLPTAGGPVGRGQFDNFIAIAVPNRGSLLGLTFFAQWLTIVQQCGFAGCNVAAAPVSDAALIQIGP